MTEQDEITIIRQRMLNNAIQHLIKEGMVPDEARARAETALNAPPAVPIPTLEELDTMTFPTDKVLSMDIDWSGCPLVQRHSGYLGGALAMKSAPRMPIEALVVNYNDGHSPEKLCAMFADLDVAEVQAIIAYAAERS